MSGTDGTFEIAGNVYRAGKLDAIKQLHVVRRLAPLIGSLQGVDIKGAMTGSEDGLLAVLGPLSTAVASMSDADTEYVLATCLAVCQRQTPGGLGWTPVWNQAAGRVMFDDLKLVSLMTLMGRVLMQNLGDFTAALPRSSPVAA